MDDDDDDDEEEEEEEDMEEEADVELDVLLSASERSSRISAGTLQRRIPIPRCWL